MLNALSVLASLVGTGALDSAPLDASFDLTALAAPSEFTLDWAGTGDGEPPPEDTETPSADAGPPKTVEPAPTPGFGRAGSHWLTFGSAVTYDFDSNFGYDLDFAWSMFIVDRLEFGVEGGAWYFDQEGQSTAGITGIFVFKYHWWSGPNGDFDWSFFTDGGTGLLGAFDEVPDGGTGFNFVQRAGAGFTKDLDASDGPAHGARLVFGVRWYHISNGRIEGDTRNPSRDSIEGYVGVSWDF